jgi:N-acetyl-gamma-glutamyl-phosphate reductase
MISVGIIGGTGYTGKKLIQYCHAHPYVKEYKVYAGKSAGENLYDYFPDLIGYVENSTIMSVDSVSYDHDLYFVALPHGESLGYIPSLISNGKYVIDLGGDYRLDFEELYIQWYKYTHTSSYLLKTKIYGLADHPDTKYNDHKFVANPGCYPTAALLSLLPLATNYSDKIVTVSCAAYSGTSGAGKKPKAELLLSEMDGNVKAYNVHEHRHEPEILQQLYKNGFSSPLSFTTHLLPVSKGIYLTASIHMNDSIEQTEISDLYEKVYEKSNFIRLRSKPPELNWVVDTNFCDINISVKGKTVIITSAIDNLIKGASGQAVQNMNKLLGWDETTGLLQKELKSVSVY